MAMSYLDNGSEERGTSLGEYFPFYLSPLVWVAVSNGVTSANEKHPAAIFSTLFMDRSD